LEPETPWGKQWFSPEAIGQLEAKGGLRLEAFELSPRLIEELRVLHPAQFLSRFQGPSLIIHGDRDSVVPYEVSKEVAASFPRVRLHTLRDADHGFPHFEDDSGAGPRSLFLKRELIGEAVNFVQGRFPK